MREALSTLSSPLFTPYLFAPYGVDLTLNTTTPLPALVGATVLGAVQCPHRAEPRHHRGARAERLRGVPARAPLYAGRRRGVRRRRLFATSAFVSAHLLGHFNLTSAFVLPLFILQCLDAVRDRKRPPPGPAWCSRRPPYIDYYYVVYELADRRCPVRSGRRRLVGPAPDAAADRTAPVLGDWCGRPRRRWRHRRHLDHWWRCVRGRGTSRVDADDLQPAAGVLGAGRDLDRAADMAGAHGAPPLRLEAAAVRPGPPLRGARLRRRGVAAHLARRAAHGQWRLRLAALFLAERTIGR